MPAEDGHYKKFEDVFGTETTEEHRPSFQKICKKQLPFNLSIQHVKNCNTMCGMWRLVYATKKLKSPEIRKLNLFLEDLSFSCGAALQEANLPKEFEGIVYALCM